jgi:hypothetical protein
VREGVRIGPRRVPEARERRGADQVCRVAEVVSCGEVHFERHVSVGLVFFFTRLSLDAICHTVDLWLLDCHQRSSTQTVLLSYPI